MKAKNRPPELLGESSCASWFLDFHGVRVSSDRMHDDREIGLSSEATGNGV